MVKWVKVAILFVVIFITRVIYRIVFFIPLLSRMMPPFVPNLSLLKPPISTIIGLTIIFFLINRSFRDARKRPSGLVVNFVYYVSCVYMLPLWYPMFYVVNLVFPWFFPILLAAGIIKILYSPKQIIPLIRITALYIVFPSCLAFFVATAFFSLNLSCNHYSTNPALKFYVNNCDSNNQVISSSLMKKSLGKECLVSIKQWYRSITPAEDTMFLGATNRCSFAYNLKNKGIENLMPQAGIMSAAFDRDSGRVFMVSSNGRLMRVYKKQTHKMEKVFSYENAGPPFWLEQDAEYRRLLVGFDYPSPYKIIVYDMDTLAPLKKDTLGARAKDGGVIKTTYSPRDKTVYLLVMCWGYGCNFIASYDLKNMRLKQTAEHETAFVMDIFYSPVLEKLFMTTPISSFGYSEIIEIDKETMLPTARMRVPIGIRDIVGDNEGFLYISNYLAGDILRIDWQSKKIVDKIHVGRRIKRMVFSKPGNAIYFTSEYGYAEIDLDKWQMPGKGK